MQISNRFAKVHGESPTPSGSFLSLNCRESSSAERRKPLVAPQRPKGRARRLRYPKLLSARSAVQDGRHLSGRAHPKARSCSEGAVSGLFPFGFRGPVVSGTWGGGGSGPGATRRAGLRPPPTSAALLIGPAAVAAAGQVARLPTGCRRSRSGWPEEAGGAAAAEGVGLLCLCERPEGRLAEGGAAAADGTRCPAACLGSGGSSRRTPLLL